MPRDSSILKYRFSRPILPHYSLNWPNRLRRQCREIGEWQYYLAISIGNKCWRCFAANRAQIYRTNDWTISECNRVKCHEKHTTDAGGSRTPSKIARTVCASSLATQTAEGRFGTSRSVRTYFGRLCLHVTMAATPGLAAFERLLVNYFVYFWFWRR